MGGAGPHQASGRRASASSTHPLPLPLRSLSPGPKNLEEKRAGKRSGPGFWSLRSGLVSLEVGQRPTVPFLPPERPPGKQRRVSGARGTREGADALTGASHAVAPPSREPGAARPARPVPAECGTGVGRGPRGERRPPGPAKAASHLTGGSDARGAEPASRGDASRQRPHLSARRGPRPRPPSLAMPGPICLTPP